MGPCLRKLLTSPENEEDDDCSTNAPFMVPVEEVSASDSALVITHSFSVIAIGENKDNSTLSQKLEYYGEDDFYYQMRTGFQYNCKEFLWPSPEVWHKLCFYSDSN